MDINELYAELGRAVRQIATVHAEAAEMNKRHAEERQLNQKAMNAIQKRVTVLSEALRMAEEGMDPVLAKLTADQSLEDADTDSSGPAMIKKVFSEHIRHEQLLNVLNPADQDKGLLSQSVPLGISAKSRD
jgi:DNA topoisomerase VI subunit B